ncbi:MAG: class II aldolase/adducin family protein [Pseudomonadota bacterium]
MTRGLLDGYVGPKFHHERQDLPAPVDLDTLLPRFVAAGRRLDAHGMAPLNGGNMSVRLGPGLVVTSSGSNLGLLESGELVYVDHCDAVAGLVRYRGPALPSSESILHHLVLAARPAAMAVVHAHDPSTTSAAMARAGLTLTDREEPYGTVALAQRAIAAFAGGRDLIVLVNHGYVCVGPSLEAVIERIVGVHLALRG